MLQPAPILRRHHRFAHADATYCLACRDDDSAISVQLCDGKVSWTGRILDDELTPPSLGTMKRDEFRDCLLAGLCGDSADNDVISVDTGAAGGGAVLNWSRVQRDKIVPVDLRLRQDVRLSADSFPGEGLRALLAELASESEAAQRALTQEDSAAPATIQDAENVETLSSSSDEDEGCEIAPASAAIDLTMSEAPASAAIDLTMSDDEKKALPTLPRPAGSNHSRFHQLRDEQDPAQPWAISLEEMLHPAGTVTHVLLSTFGHARQQLTKLRERLEALCPQLEEICLVSDWKNTAGVGATSIGDVGESEGFTKNPNIYHPPDEAGDFRAQCTVVFPPIAGDRPDEHEAKGRAKHSIQHTKLLLVRHCAASEAAGSTSSAAAADSEAYAHLRVHIMSCNVDNVLSQRGKMGDVVYRSPALPALPHGETRPDLLIATMSDAGFRFGVPMYKMLRAMTDTAVEAAEEADDTKSARRIREWPRMLATYDLTHVPDDVHVVFNMPGTYPALRELPRGHATSEAEGEMGAAAAAAAAAGGAAASVIGTVGGRVKGWEYAAKDGTKDMAKNVEALLRAARSQHGADRSSYRVGGGADSPLQICLKKESEVGPENEHDPLAMLVLFVLKTEPTTAYKVGRLSRRDAAGLTKLLAAGAVGYNATLEIVRHRPPAKGKGGRSATPTSAAASSSGGDAEASQKLSLPPLLPNVSLYVDVTVLDIGAPGGDPDDWLELAAVLRCNLGLGRLREVLAATGPWNLHERTAFTSVSASLGRDLGFMRSFASAADGTVDLDAWPKAKVLEEMRWLEVMIPEGNGRKGPTKEMLKDALREHVGDGAGINSWNKATLLEALAREGVAVPEGEVKSATVPVLKEKLRPYVQPTSRLPSIILPGGHAAGALMGDLKAFNAFSERHREGDASGAPPLLNNLDIDAGVGVHPRVASQRPDFARRLTHSHSKIVVSTFDAGGSARNYGWCYMGSHNFSATAWGSPWVQASGGREMIVFSSWEVGVILTVPHGTPAAEAERRMAFDAWPVQFDPKRLHPYQASDDLDARDSFAMMPALRAKQEGDKHWRDLIPADVRERMARKQIQNSRYHEELEQIFLEATRIESLKEATRVWREEGEEGEDDDDDDDRHGGYSYGGYDGGHGDWELTSLDAELTAEAVKESLLAVSARADAELEAALAASLVDSRHRMSDSQEMEATMAESAAMAASDADVGMSDSQQLKAALAASMADTTMGESELMELAMAESRKAAPPGMHGRPGMYEPAEASSSTRRKGKHSRQQEPEVISVLTDDDEEAESARVPRIVIDLSCSPQTKRPRTVAAASGTAADAAIDLDAEDDASVAREMQARFDTDDDGGSPAGGGPIDFKALNDARQRRLERKERLAGGSSSAQDGQESDLLLSQRSELKRRCESSAKQLRLRVARLEHNRASQLGQPLYERFVAAWSRVPDKTLKIVFHATADSNMESICKSGLNQRKRGSANGQVGGAGEYFGREVAVSAPYNSGSRRMLVFAILMDRSGLRSMDQAHPGEVVIHKSEHQLPLAIVTFDRVPAADLQAGPAFAARMGGGAAGGMVNAIGNPLVPSEAERFPGEGRTLGGD